MVRKEYDVFINCRVKKIFYKNIGYESSITFRPESMWISPTFPNTLALSRNFPALPHYFIFSATILKNSCPFSATQTQDASSPCFSSYPACPKAVQVRCRCTCHIWSSSYLKTHSRLACGKTGSGRLGGWGWSIRAIWSFSGDSA